MDNVFTMTSLYKSLIKEIQFIIADVLTNGISEDIQYHAWDSRGAITELPAGDLLGLVNWSYSENGGLPLIEAGLLLSTVYDLNLFKEAEILNVIRDHCWDSVNENYLTWRLFDDGNDEYAKLQVTEFEILPSGRSEVRSTRHVGIELIKASNVQ